MRERKGREESEGGKRNEKRGRGRDNLSYQAGIKGSQRETNQATGRETALLKCWHSTVCESVCVCSRPGRR